jgi:hypothetical protein
VNRAADQFRLQWAETRSRACLAAAQALDIEGGLLNGLYAIRRIHKDWLDQPPVVSPASLMYVPPLFRHALDLCRTQSDAVRFPIAGLKPALERLHRQVVASRQSLQAGQWQTTGDGQQYAQRRGPIRTGNGDSPPNPFTRLEVACWDLQHVLEQLQHTLVHGPTSLHTEAAVAPRARPAAAVPDTPAPAQASGPPAHPVATKPHPAAGCISGPMTDHRVPRRTPSRRRPAQPRTARAAQEPLAPRMAAPRVATPALPPVRPRPSHQAATVRSASPPATPSTPSTPLASPTHPPALSPADDRAPSSPMDTLVTPPPVDPAAEAAAQLRQERLAALQTTLAPLQAEASRLSGIAQAAATSDAGNGQRWDRPNQEFAAWQAVVQAYDACTANLAMEAAALFGPGSEDPEVRRLQQHIGKASRQALACASEAANNTLAAFAQTCDLALVKMKLKDAGFDSYTQLAAHCRDLHDEWEQAPLRPRMPELEGRRTGGGPVGWRENRRRLRRAPHRRSAAAGLRTRLRAQPPVRTARAPRLSD